MSGKLPKEMLSELKPFAWLSEPEGWMTCGAPCAICKVTSPDISDSMIYDIRDVIFDDLYIYDFDTGMMRYGM